MMNMEKLRDAENYAENWNNIKRRLIFGYGLRDEIEYDTNFYTFEKMFDALLIRDQLLAENLLSVYKFSDIEVVKQLFTDGYVFWKASDSFATKTGAQEDIFNITDDNRGSESRKEIWKDVVEKFKF